MRRFNAGLQGRKTLQLDISQLYLLLGALNRKIRSACIAHILSALKQLHTFSKTFLLAIDNLWMLRNRCKVIFDTVQTTAQAHEVVT